MVLENIDREFVVIHPLDDAPEKKLDVKDLGPMSMRGSVRISLIALRAYLVVMMILALYQALDLAGLWGS
jgi:hypothetical protein